MSSSRENHDNVGEIQLVGKVTRGKKTHMQEKKHEKDIHACRTGNNVRHA
jgi:hypothetical protein